jgi:hypothetical protein
MKADKRATNGPSMPCTPVVLQGVAPMAVVGVAEVAASRFLQQDTYYAIGGACAR